MIRSHSPIHPAESGTPVLGAESPVPLRVRGLVAGYGPVAVARGISFDLGRGGLVALLGVNGCGKTTIMKTVAGLLAPLGGAISFGGIPLAGLSLAARARRIAYVSQTGGSAWPYTVYEIVAAARFVRTGVFGRFRPGDASAVESSIAAMDLEALRDRPYTSLSGGEARRVLIARALAQETPLVLLDEPCAHLDPGRQIELMERFSRLAAAGTSLLVSLHDVNLARRYAGTIVLVMPDGSSITGTPDTVLVRETLERAYNTEFLFGHHEEYGGYVLPKAMLNGRQ